MTYHSASFAEWKACCRLLAIFQLSFVPLWSTSSVALEQKHHQQHHRSDRFERGIYKMKRKFVDWSDEYGKDATLWVDGNNLRGMGKFEWTPFEVQEKVACFCCEYNITKTIIVWDHGTIPFACSRTLMTWKELENISNLDLDIVIIFSGLSKRADDVIIQESKRLVSSQNHGDGSSMAFVTSDRELNYQLYRQSVWQDFRECGNDDDTSCDECLQSAPLFCDSTRFLELLRLLETNLDWMEEDTSQEIESSLLDVKQRISLFHKQQRRGYNPKREKTWERVVLAETFRRSLCIQDVVMTFSLQSTLHSTFTNAFLIDLQSRGYLTCSSMKNETLGIVGWLQYGDYHGPSRLDKQQRRSLTRFNRFQTVK
jgi:hypothetical protein